MISLYNYYMISLLFHHICTFIDEENEQGQTALMFASLFDRQEIINTLIDKGANPAHMDKAGNSVADIALSQGNYELAKVLREQNAN